MNQQITVIDQFAGDLSTISDQLAAVLPKHIDRERFEQTAIIAVKNNPDLLKADRKSLLLAISEAAEDGLHPDGREGIITMYKQEAVWNPMLHGLRKRAREMCDMVIDAQVVYQNDKFVWHQGDDPRIEHTPAPLGTDRGKGVGAYAIFKVGKDVLHREVMTEFDINQVKSCSRAQSSLMWTKFWMEGWKKVVIRRGIKTVPSVNAVQQNLERIISREDRDFDFAPRNITPADDVPSAPSLVAPSDVPPSPPAADVSGMIADPGIADPGTPPASEPLHGEVLPPEPKPAAKPKAAEPEATGTTLEKFEAEVKKAKTPTELNPIWDRYEKQFKSAEDRAAAGDIFEKRYIDITGG